MCYSPNTYFRCEECGEEGELKEFLPREEETDLVDLLDGVEEWTCPSCGTKGKEKIVPIEE